MNANSISNCSGQGQRLAQKTCPALVLAKAEAAPFSPTKTLKFKIKNTAVLRELTRINAKYRLTIRPLDCSPCRSLGEGGWNHLNQSPFREIPRNSAKFRLTFRLYPVVSALPRHLTLHAPHLALARGSLPLYNDL
jgi:hypothetical protein